MEKDQSETILNNDFNVVEHQGLNAQPSAQRVHIGFFGMRNAKRGDYLD